MFNRRAKLFDWRAVCLAAGLAVAASTNAPAQNTQDLQRWTKVCNPDANTGQEGCAVVYRIFANQSTIVLQLSLSYLLSEPNQIILSAWIPTGVFVDQGMALTVDGQQVELVPFRLCDQQICIAETQVDLTFVNQLKAGLQMVVSAIIPDQTEGARQIDLPVTLTGFTATYDGPGLTPDQAAAAQEAVNQALLERAEEARQRLIEQQQQLNATPAPAGN